MAYNLSDEEVINRAVTDPDWVLFYHRAHLKLLLPAMAQAYLLVGNLQQELLKSQERDQERAQTIKDERNPDCVLQWPDCEAGKYHPQCCRFPKRAVADFFSQRYPSYSETTKGRSMTESETKDLAVQLVTIAGGIFAIYCVKTVLLRRALRSHIDRFEKWQAESPE